MAMDIVRDYPLLVGALALIVLGAGLGLWQLQQRLLRSEHERRRAAEELNRRLSELFSLQELSYGLSHVLALQRGARRPRRPAPGRRRARQDVHRRLWDLFSRKGPSSVWPACAELGGTGPDRVGQ